MATISELTVQVKRHLNMVHQLTDMEQRVQFGIPAKQALVAKSDSNQKKAFALESNLGDKMQAGRKAKAVVEVEADVKTPVPAKRVKDSVPAVRKKADVPEKVKTNN
jgi:hypothetical protein